MYLLDQALACLRNETRVSGSELDAELVPGIKPEATLGPIELTRLAREWVRVKSDEWRAVRDEMLALQQEIDEDPDIQRALELAREP